MTLEPVFREVGEAALLVEFGDSISVDANDAVMALDAALSGAPPIWLVETVPAYCSLLVVLDPLSVMFNEVAQYCLAIVGSLDPKATAGKVHDVAVSYDGPDLPVVAERLNMTPDEAVNHHLAGDYRVFMYGFAPGYAYLGGVPEALRLPRKPKAERGHPAGSVIIAGEQCLITTLDMPTGWWAIGRTDAPVLQPYATNPFLFAPGDRLRFHRA